MLRKHAAVIGRINNDPQIKSKILQYFGIVRSPEYLTPVLYQRGLGQADLVLCLLRIGGARARVYVEQLIGHSITIGPPCLLLYRTNGKPRPAHQRAADDRKVIFVVPGNPRVSNTGAALRWNEVKLGKTVSQLRSRGVWKRDIRIALKRGWIKLEDTTHA